MIWNRTVYTVDDAQQCIIPIHEEGTGYFQKWIDENHKIALVENKQGRMYEIWSRNLEFLDTKE